MAGAGEALRPQRRLRWVLVHVVAARAGRDRHHRQRSAHETAAEVAGAERGLARRPCLRRRRAGRLVRLRQTRGFPQAAEVALTRLRRRRGRLEHPLLLRQGRFSGQGNRPGAAAARAAQHPSRGRAHRRGLSRAAARDERERVHGNGALPGIGGLRRRHLAPARAAAGAALPRLRVKVPVVPWPGMREEPLSDRTTASAASADDATFDLTLRPRDFDEVVGQRALIDNLKVFVKAAGGRKEPLDHVLFCGPPGLGKTSLAHVIAHELGSQIHVTSGPALERKGDLAGILTNLAENDVLFIDEIHRMNPAIEENLYPAMESFTFDIVIGDGAGARALKLPLKRFTLIGATTRTGLLTGPLRDRFGIVSRLDYYPAEDLQEIVRRSALKLTVRLDDGGAREIARRARGTPRIANRLLRRVRDFAEVEGDGAVNRPVADRALQRLEVDAAGLDAMDRKILVSLIDKFGGGPVGLETLATVTGERSDTLEDVYEPYLLMEGYLARTPRGRVATQRAFEHLGKKAPAGLQGSLL